MTKVIVFDDETQHTICLKPRHATMRKVPNEDYCFSVRLYGISRFEIEDLMQCARNINQEYEER